jgi:hypothetical protein
MDNKAIAAIMATAILLLCLVSPLEGAVRIRYEVDSGDDLVYINEDYDVAETVTVSETTAFSFESVTVDQVRSVKGAGEAELKQQLIGKPSEGSGYIAENNIKSSGEMNIDTSFVAESTKSYIYQTADITGDTDLDMKGKETDAEAGHNAVVKSGSQSSKQMLAINGNSVLTSLELNGKGDSGQVGSYARYTDKNRAKTSIEVLKGKMNTKLDTTSKDGGALIHQVCEIIEAAEVTTSSQADASQGTLAQDVVALIDPRVSTIDQLTGASPDGEALIHRVCYIAEAAEVTTSSQADASQGSFAQDVVALLDPKVSSIDQLTGASPDGEALIHRVRDIAEAAEVTSEEKGT